MDPLSAADTPSSAPPSQPAHDQPTTSTQDATPSPSSSTPQLADVDPQILEALKSKDRLFVLKLGEQFEALIKDRRPRVDLLPPATSYQRLLVHRVSAYYKLQPESDPTSKGIVILLTAEARIPVRRVCELVPAESPTQPAFKIMRRSPNQKPASQAGSIAGEDTELSDIEPSDSASFAGKGSNAKKARLTIEQREAAYREARSRIFMDFNEEDKGKDKDLSASSSSVSLTSASASTSTGPRSSVDDTDDASSPATESEWSGPSLPNPKKDTRRYAPSSRSGQTYYNPKNPRTSRAPSPSFTFPSLYDPAHNVTQQLFDPSQSQPPPPPPNVGYTPNQYGYPPYSPPSQGPSPGFMPPYPYQSFHPYQSPPPHGPPVNEPPGVASPEAFSPPPMAYSAGYVWPHPAQQPLQSPQHAMHLQPGQQPPPPPPGQPMGPPLPPPPFHYPYAPHPPGAYYPHPSAAYYPVPHPGQPGPPMQPMHAPMNAPPQQPHFDGPRPGVMVPHPPAPPPDQFNPHNHNGNRNSGVHIAPPHNGNNHGNNARSPVRHSNNTHNNNMVLNGKTRNGARDPWNNYGPGGGGMGGPTTLNGSLGSDTVGPRFNNRRTSNNSSSSNSRSSNGDEVSSQTSSSTTSSSSRRTYTSTTSSQQHPLPARPDWAVGMIAQPSLAGRAHEPTLTPPRNVSSPRNGQHIPPHNGGNHANNGQGRPGFSSGSGNSLQSSADFPPLSTMSPSMSAEKRTGPTGAWGVASRPILSPANGNVHSPPQNSLPPPVGIGNGSPRLDDQNRASLNKGEFQPKLMRRPATGNILQQGMPQKPQADGVAILARQTAAMSLKDQGRAADGPSSATTAVGVLASASTESGFVEADASASTTVVTA